MNNYPSESMISPLKTTVRTLTILMATTIVYSCNNPNAAQQTKDQKVSSKETITKTDEEWKKILTPQQYHVLREKGTDRPFTGELYLNTKKGLYSCAACGNELFTSDMKFDSDCGWPSFDKSIAGGKITTATDTSYGMVRTEILCGRCGSHLGHLFDDGPTLTGKRYCVNSTSISFESEKNKE